MTSTYIKTVFEICYYLSLSLFIFLRRSLTNGDPADGPQPRTSNMALLGALAAAGGGRRGCVLRVAADAITFYCGGGGGGNGVGVGVGGGGGGADNGDVGVAGGGVGAGDGGLDAGAADDDGDGPVDFYLRAAGRSAIGGRGRTAADYFRPVRSVASVGDEYYDTGGGNGSAAAAAAAAGGTTALANVTAGIEQLLNGSYNHTIGVENVEDLTNYIFVITIGIILGAMILTTICGKSYAQILFRFGIVSCVCMVLICAVRTGPVRSGSVRTEYKRIKRYARRPTDGFRKKIRSSARFEFVLIHFGSGFHKKKKKLFQLSDPFFF